MALSQRDAHPRYVEIASIFRQRIDWGEWPLGSKIPSLESLSKETGAAIETVRKAIAILSQEKLLVAQRPKGTFVLNNSARVKWSAIELGDSGALHARGNPEIKLNGVTVTHTLPFLFHEAKDVAAYRRIERVYWQDGIPFLLDNLYIDDAIAEPIVAEGLATSSGRDIVRRLFKLNSVTLHQTITVLRADVSAAKHLKVQLNSPTLRIDRSYITKAGVRALSSIAIYRGDVVRLDFRQASPQFD